MVHGDSVIAETKDTIEPDVRSPLEEVQTSYASKKNALSESEGKPGFLRSLSKILLGDLEVTDGKQIIGDKAFHGAGAILNLKLGAILLVCAGGRRVVFGVKEARDGSAALARHPQVARTCIQDNFELFQNVSAGIRRAV